MFVRVNGRWIINLSKVKYLGLSNENQSKIEVKYEDGESVTFSCDSEETALRNLQHILDMFDPNDGGAIH